MPEQFLDGTQVRAVGEQMRRKRVTQRMRVKIPIDVRKAHVFLYEPSNGTLGQPPPRVIKKNSLTVWGPLPPASRRRFLREQLLTQAPIVVERFLCLRSVRHDALLVAFAANSQYAFLLIDINQVQPGKFAHAQPRRVKKFQQRTIAPHI